MQDNKRKNNNPLLKLAPAFVALMSPFLLFAQPGSDDRSVEEAEKQNIIEQRIEIIAGTLEDGQTLDYTSLLEDLTYYFEHPLDLNSANTEDLRDLNLLSDIQIAYLQSHIARYGYLRSLFRITGRKGI